MNFAKTVFIKHCFAAIFCNQLHSMCLHQTKLFEMCEECAILPDTHLKTVVE